MSVRGTSHSVAYADRIRRYEAAYAAAGAEVLEIPLAELSRREREIEGADVLLLWRVQSAAPVGEALARARRSGACVVLDVDDPSFDLDVAEPHQREEGALLRGTLAVCDACTCPTAAIAVRIQRHAKPAYVLPDGYDEAGLKALRLVVRERDARSDGGPLRLGFVETPAPCDLAVAYSALQRVLRERPGCRLVEAGTAAQGSAQLDIHLLPRDAISASSEAASEWAFVQTALAGVPSVASPVGALRSAVRDGETGLLVDSDRQWYEALLRLVDDAALRARIGRNAQLDVLWPFGAERRAERVTSLLEALRGGPSRAAPAFELEICREQRRSALPLVPASDIVFRSDKLENAEITVIVPLHNYAEYVTEALESVRAQTLALLDLIVVDDASSDDSLQVAHRWLREQRKRFNRVLLLRHSANAGLGPTRNSGFAASETPFVLPLDADNALLPQCCAHCLTVLHDSGAAFAYPLLQKFGEETGLMGGFPYSPARLAGGNFIDALALVRKAAWACVGGYDNVRFGWEDYDLWCRFAERGFFGVQVDEPLALYRVHGTSMRVRHTNVEENQRSLIEDMQRRHPWLTLR